MEKVSQKEFMGIMREASYIRRSYLPVHVSASDIIERIKGCVLRYHSHRIVISKLRSRGFVFEDENENESVLDLTKSDVYKETVSDKNGHVYDMYVVRWPGNYKVAYFI